MLQKLSWKKFLRDSILYISFISAIVAGFIGLFLVDRVLRVDEIIVKQTGKKITVTGLQAFQGNSMLLLKEDEVVRLLKRDNPKIADITVDKKYPGTLTITIKTRQPVAALTGDVGFYLVAEDGTILEKVREEPSNLPKITHYQKLPFLNNQAGQNVNFTDISLSLSFYKRFLKLGLKPLSIDIQDYSMIRFIFAEEKEVRITAEKESEFQWYQIERLVKDLEIRGEKYRLIDVRFDKPYYEQQ